MKTTKAIATILAALAALVTDAALGAEQVFSTDFNSGVPGVFSGVTATAPASLRFLDGVGTGTNVFSGNMLINQSGGNPASPTTLTLTGLPEHNAISLSFLLSTIRTWDGSLPNCCSPDFFNVAVDGVVVFSETFSSSGPGPSQSYNPPAGVYLGDGVYDPAYNMGLDPVFQNLPHTSSTLTIQWFAGGSGWQGGDDEYWAIDNVAVDLQPSCEMSGEELMGRFPERTSTVDLTDRFRGNVEKFLAALAAARDFRGNSNPPTIMITETYRSPARAYLMHYAFLITKATRLQLDPSGNLTLTYHGRQIIVKQPSEVDPPVADLADVCWVQMNESGTPDWPATIDAAGQMIRECCPSGIAHAPAYPSNHQYGTAIDMTITWNRELVIPLGNGHAAVVTGGPRNGGHNRDLQAVGALFGVVHFVGHPPDPPHWSIDGH